MPLVYVNILLAKCLGFLLGRNHSINQEPQEICFIKLLGFGSVVMASDSIFSIKKKFSNAKISIICSKSIEGGIRSLHLFDEVYVINDDSFGSVATSSIKTLFHLQKLKKLWTIDLETYSKLTGVFALWTMALNRFGFYFNQVAFRYNLNTHNVYFNTQNTVEENYQEMAKATGVTNISSFTIPGFPKRKAFSNYNCIAINNTCSDLSIERKLTEQQLISICNWVVENTPYKIALLGAPIDKQNNLSLIQKLDKNDRIENIAGDLDFESYYQFLYNECALVVTIDSAPLHIANKLSLPVVSIWGPTSPRNYVDVEMNNIQIYQQVHCSPCVHHVKNLPCGGNNFCIKNISTNSVTDAIQEMINRNA